VGDELGGAGFRRAVDAHLGSRDVARVIYGSIIGLALVVALAQHPPTAGQTAAAIIATAVAVGLAELFSEYVGLEARERRRVEHREVRHLAGEAVAVACGAGFPALFFILSAAGVLGLDTAFSLAKWSGLGLICAYGFAASRLAGVETHRALLHAAALGLIGAGLIAVKALLH
jgi:hypothetical protein